MISPETFDFLSEIVAGGDVDACLRGLRALRAPYRPQASELALAYYVRALERGGRGIALTGFDLEGASLRGWRSPVRPAVRWCAWRTASWPVPTCATHA